MATWPSSLPDPLKKSYKIEPGSQVIRSDMDSGMARQRRRFTARIDLVYARLVLTSVQLDTLETFVADEIDGGAAWFDIPLKDGAGKRTMEARIRGGNLDEIVMIDADRWQVGFVLEVRNR